MKPWQERALIHRRRARELVENALKVDGKIRMWRLIEALKLIHIHGPSNIRGEAKFLMRQLEKSQ